jgi:hypothetical protein
MMEPCAGRVETLRRDERGYALPGAQVPLMLRRLRREQSGVALGLVVILVVLIGVRPPGFLPWYAATRRP